MSAAGRASASCAAPNVISRHLGALWANTKHRNASDDPDVRTLATHRLVVMLMEYPERVALSAIDRWPTTPDGAWFPTEHELRALCVEIQRAIRPPPPDKGPSPEYAHPPEHRAEMKRRLHGLDRFLKTGDPGDDPVLLAAKAKNDARLRMARDAGFPTVQAWLAGKR